MMALVLLCTMYIDVSVLTMIMQGDNMSKGQRKTKDSVRKGTMKRIEADIDVVFTQPHFLSAQLVRDAESRSGVRDTIVGDIAFNMRLNDFKKTTLAFIEALGDNLIYYVDHHENRAWNDPKCKFYDPRYLYPPFNFARKAEAPACPCLINPEIIRALVFNREHYRLFLHGDFDGIMFGAMVAHGGKEPYKGAVLDSIIADTCNVRKYGQLSRMGQRYDRALKAARIDDNSKRHAMFNELVFNDTTATMIIDQAERDFLPIEGYTQHLARAYQLHGRVAFLDASRAESRFDRRLLLLLGQEKSNVAVIRIIRMGNPQFLVAGPEDEWNFPSLFNLSGGNTNKVTLSGIDWNLQRIVNKIDEAKN